ncbi:MAG: hypothetical protein RL368_89 [Pseudomonadota bacterium]|jgi:CRISPR-associated protein Cmr1
METLTATFKIVTPMFLGDAQQNAVDIRPPSVKGALRFWWRAMMWGKVLQEAQNKPVQALKNLHEQEADLFGCSAGIYKEKHFGQAKFLLQVIHGEPTNEKSYPIKSTKSTGSAYLGYGLMESKPPRNAMKEGLEFKLHFTFKPTATKEDIESIKQVLEVFGLFGGLGSRSRRAFGSITSGDNIFDKKEAYEQKLAAILTLGKNITSYPPYAAFSSFTKYKVLFEANSAREAQEKAGNAYKNWRGQVKQKYEKQADKIKSLLAFGIPLKGGTDQDKEARFASPLFFHIHPVGDKFVCVALFLPSLFHPTYFKKYFKETNNKSLTEFYKDVSDFIA